MIDTGSTISAIDKQYLQQLNHKQLIEPTNMYCKTANNDQLCISGVTKLALKISDQTFQISAFVIENLCTELLLGCDFIERYRANINCVKKCLVIQVNGNRLTIPFIRYPSSKQLFNIETVEDIVIPPRSTQVIQAITSAPTTTAVFTPRSKQLNSQHILAPYAIIKVNHNNLTTLTLLNPTAAAQKSKKGIRIGQISCHEENKCSYVSPTRSAVRSKTHSSLDNSLLELTNHLNRQQQQQISPILLKYQTLFDTSQPSVIQTHGVNHRIPIQPHYLPIQSYPYRKSAKETEIINEQIQEMLANKVIRPSTSPWSSPVVIIKKKDGSPRFCVDYRKLNLITERDVYPLPRIDDIIDKLCGSRFFSTFDLKSGYWQIPIEEADRKKTAFITTDGLYEFNVLPFGLSNAPGSFQRIMNLISGNLRWDMTLVYLDDVIVYSTSFNQHLQHLELVFQALHQANVKLNIKKCSLARKELDYLGFRITQHGIKPTTLNVKKTLDFPTPTSAQAAYSFIQLAQFYRKFIKNFPSIAAPLNVFKSKNVPFVWTSECQRSFESLKQILSQYPLLAFYDGKSDLKLSLSTDASNKGIGGVLHQITLNGQSQPIQYLSRSLSKREQKYSVVEKECLAMVWAINKLRPYLYGRDFTLITDHHPLCWLNKQSSKNGRLDRWSLQLQEYSFNIKHTPGRSNCVADCLSRFPQQLPDDVVEAQLDTMHGSINTISQVNFDATIIGPAQQSDKKIKELYDKLQQGKLFSSYILENDQVYKIIHRVGYGKLQIPCVPQSMVPQILKAYHDHPTSGHLGINKTWMKLRDRFFWPSMYESIKHYVSTCESCKKFKTNRTRSTGTLQPIEPPEGVWDLLGLDFVGPVPISSDGNKYIIVCTDYLSKFAIAQPTRDCSAETAAKFLVNNIILQYGVPKQLLTDQGTHFMAKVFQAVASKCGVNHISSTTYHPQCNGLTERFNATLVDAIGPYVNQSQSDWDEYVPYITFAYNTAKHSTTEVEPFKLMHGRDAILPFDTPLPITKLSSVSDYYSQLVRFLTQAKSTVWYKIKQAQNIYKRTYDTGRHDLPPLKPGQLVFLKQMMQKYLRKFSPKYYGPFRILRQISRLNYEVQNVNTGSIEKVHVSRIRLI